MTAADPTPRDWRFAAHVALRVVAAIGALLAAGQLALDLFFLAVSRGSDTSAMTFGSTRVADPWFALTLFVLAVVLGLIAMGSRHGWVQAAGAAVGLAGTVLSAVGLMSGGGAGPAPAAYWWVLLVVAGIASAGSATARRALPQAH